MISGFDPGTGAIPAVDAVDGHTVDRRPFRVEAGHVLLYGRAIGDAALAAALAPDGTPVPPTFIMTDLLLDPAHMRGAEAIGYLGVRPDPRRVVLLARQHFDVNRALRVGDRLLITDTWLPRSEKIGRSGARLLFQEIVKTAIDESGEPVITARTLLVETERPAGQAQARRAEEPGHDGCDVLTLPEITRTVIVQFCGATGDFSLLHTDEPHARAQGFPSVLAHGLMLMAQSIRPVTDRFGVQAVCSCQATFLAPVYPGDTLTVRTHPEPVSGMHAASSSFRISTTNGDGVEVLAGTATGNWA
jgi:acyl dehydratase